MDISPEAMEKLTGFNWPGNVRELNNVLERAVFVAEGIIEEDDIILDYHSLSEQENKTGNEVGTDSDDFTHNIRTILGELRFIPTFRAVGAARLITPKA